METALEVTCENPKKPEELTKLKNRIFTSFEKQGLISKSIKAKFIEKQVKSD